CNDEQRSRRACLAATLRDGGRRDPVAKLGAGAMSSAPKQGWLSTAFAPLPAPRCARPSPGRTLGHFGVARRLFGVTKLRGSRLELSPKSSPSHT
ncbi:MAG: hypothetical protein ACREVA_11610, partial [Burkholderiales bacterium]